MMKRFFQLLLFVVCTELCANTYTDGSLTFDYPDDFLIENPSNAVNQTVTIYTSTGDAVAQYTLMRSMAANNLSDDKLPARLDAMQSVIIRKLADMTDYQSVKFGKATKTHLAHIHGAQKSFEETTTDGSILKGKVFIAAKGSYFLEALLLATDEQRLAVLDESLQSVRFGDLALPRTEPIAKPSQPEEPSSTPQDDSGVVYLVVEKMPEFPGGQQALFAYLAETVKYPAIAVKNKIQGRVICQFIVETDGSITDVEVVSSGGHYSLDDEAVRVIRSMPKWKPGKHNGKAVRVKYTVPVSFRLE